MPPWPISRMIRKEAADETQMEMIRGLRPEAIIPEPVELNGLARACDRLP
jgi:hypothetical protein